MKKAGRLASPDQMLEHYVPEDQLESVKAFEGPTSREGHHEQSPRCVDPHRLKAGGDRKEQKLASSIAQGTS